MINTFSHEQTQFDVLLNIRASLPKYIDGKRLMHTICVEQEAIKIAKMVFPKLCIDEKYLYDISAAALLHDMTKKYTDDMQRAVCEREGESYLSSPTLHAKTGAYEARRIFDINEYVFSAIYNHTTGKPNMNVFEKIIFLADYIEQTRTAEACVKTRDYFYTEAQKNDDIMSVIDNAILLCIDNTIAYLTDKGLHVEQATLQTRTFLLAEARTADKGEQE